jgi:hypothetical protein
MRSLDADNHSYPGVKSSDEGTASRGCGLGVRAMQRGLLELSIVERPTRGRRQLSFVEH